MPILCAVMYTAIAAASGRELGQTVDDARIGLRGEYLREHVAHVGSCRARIDGRDREIVRVDRRRILAREIELLGDELLLPLRDAAQARAGRARLRAIHG